MGHQINMISLFTGIGGFDLAAETLDWNILFQSEIDKYCIQVLNQRFPNIPKYGNINEIDATKFSGHVDVVAGGFPCQPFSNAGPQQGAEDPRFLWPQMYRVIRECRPTWVVAENVLGLISNADGLVFEQVCTDLESEGYEVQPFVIPAAGKDTLARKRRSIGNITVIGPKDFMLATIKTRIAKSIFPKSASIVANHPLNIMMPSVFVTDIQNEPCYLN